MKYNCFVNICSIILLAICFNTSALASFGDKSYAHGWYWGDRLVADKEQADELPQQIIKPSDEEQYTPSATAIKQALTELVNEAQADAVLYRTKEKVVRFLRLKNQMEALATDFSITWETVLRESPELDYSLRRPASKIASQIYNENHKGNKQQLMREFAARYGFIFIYKGGEQLSAAMAKIINLVASAYGINLVALTVDGTSSPELPNTQADNGQGNYLHATVFPALFALDTKSNKVIPITYGYLSEFDLIARIENILTDYSVMR